MVAMDAGPRVSRTGQPESGLTRSDSHTLRGGNRGARERLRANLIDAIVQAIAGASDPRLHRSRHKP